MNQQTAAQNVPAGWYPDPYGQAAERYWDGIAWSQDFVRQAIPQQPAQQAQAPVTYGQNDLQPQYAAGQQGGQKGIIPMVLATLLWLVRIPYAANSIDTADGSAYSNGAFVGTAVGFVLTGLLFAWGFNRYHDQDGVNVQMALVIAGAGLGLSFLLA